MGRPGSTAADAGCAAAVIVPGRGVAMMRAMHASVLASAGSVNERGTLRLRPTPRSGSSPTRAEKAASVRALTAPAPCPAGSGARGRAPWRQRRRESRRIVGLRSQMLPGAGRDGQADPGPVQPHSIGGHRALENSGTLGRGELLPGGQPQDLLVARLQVGERDGNGAGQFRDVVRLVLRRRPGPAFAQRVVEANRLGLAPAQVGDLVEGHPVEPGHGDSRYVVKAAPRHQEGLGHDLLGQVRPHTALGEVTHTRVVLAVQRGEALRVVGNGVLDRHPGDPARGWLFGTDITLITSVPTN